MYVTPKVEVIEVELQGFLCTSGVVVEPSNVLFPILVTLDGIVKVPVSALPLNVLFPIVCK